MNVGPANNLPDPLEPRVPPQAGDAAPDAERIPEDLVDQFFDGELDDAARRAFLRALPGDLDRCEEVAKTRRMLDLLRTVGSDSLASAPDLTVRIIAAVDRRRGFASRRVRQFARVARLAVAAGVVLFVGAVAAVERVAPDATRLAPAPAPLTSALRESQAEMASTFGSIASTIQQIQLRVEGEHLPHATVYAHTPDAPHAHPHTAHITFEHAPLAPDATPAKHLGGPQRVTVVERVGTAPTARRTFTVGLAYSLKADPRNIAWTMDMAPTAGRVPTGISPGMIDADGRCSNFVMPLGVERGDRDGGPFVLPGRDVQTIRVRTGIMQTPSGRGLLP